MSIWSVIGTVAGGLFGGPAGAAIGGSLGGALDQNNANSDARHDQQQATDQAIAEQRRIDTRTYGDLGPYRTTGGNALKTLWGEIDQPLTPAEVMSDPGYRFGLTQGQQAIDRKIAAGGGRVSGQAIKASARFGTDYAAGGYDAAFRRKQMRLDRLSQLAQMGQSASTAGGVSGANAANQISGYQSSQGDANAASRLAQPSIWQNPVNQIAAIYGRGKSGGTGYSDTDDGFYTNPQYGY